MASHAAVGEPPNDPDSPQGDGDTVPYRLGDTVPYRLGDTVPYRLAGYCS
jgi:hypothetical protein